MCWEHKPQTEDQRNRDNPSYPHRTFNFAQQPVLF
jgi:hypothetical protein